MCFYCKTLQVFYLQVAEEGGLCYQFMDFILCCCNSGCNVAMYSYVVLICCISCFKIHESTSCLNHPRLSIVEYVHSGVWIIGTSVF